MVEKGTYALKIGEQWERGSTLRSNRERSEKSAVSKLLPRAE